jgi:hypothetical protein
MYSVPERGAGVNKLALKLPTCTAITLKPRINASAAVPEILNVEFDPLKSIVEFGPSRISDPVIIVIEPEETIALPLATISEPDVIEADAAVKLPDGTEKFIDCVVALHTATVPEFGI